MSAKLNVIPQDVRSEVLKWVGEGGRVLHVWADDLPGAPLRGQTFYIVAVTTGAGGPTLQCLRVWSTSVKWVLSRDSFFNLTDVMKEVGG